MILSNRNIILSNRNIATVPEAQKQSQNVVIECKILGVVFAQVAEHHYRSSHSQ